MLLRILLIKLGMWNKDLKDKNRNFLHTYYRFLMKYSFLEVSLDYRTISEAFLFITL